jgi:hypothetical protein
MAGWNRDRANDGSLWLWVPGRAEPVIGPRFARTRWLARDDAGELGQARLYEKLQ